MDEQDTRQNTELKKSVVRSVLLCLSCLFMYTRFSHYRVAPGDRIRRPEQPN